MTMKFEDLKGKEMQLTIRFKGDSRNYFYHGQVIDVDKNHDKIWIDDMILGRIWFWRSQVYSFRELEYHDYLKLAPKSERARLKMKLGQAEMKASESLSDIKKKLLGG